MTTRIIRFRPTVQTFHRYAPEDMCGSLPDTLYKVLPAKFARRFVEKGEMMWSTLTWFQNDEDAARGDASEGMRRYFPVTGLEVTRHEHQGRPDETKFVSPDEGVVSRAVQSDHIFIYSLTLEPSLSIGDASDRTCVTILDPRLLFQRVHQAVTKHRSARPQTLIHNEIKYWASEHPPEEVWALPDRLTMHKHVGYQHQREYRFAVGTRADVFDFQNVEGLIVHKDYRWPRLTLDPQTHRMKLKVGPLTDCCKLP